MGTKGVVNCANCGDSAFFEGVCPNDIIRDTGYQQMNNMSWVCASCGSPGDLTLLEAFEMMLELATGNMIHTEDAMRENDPTLFKEALTQEKAYDMVRMQINDMKETGMFDE